MFYRQFRNLESYPLGHNGCHVFTSLAVNVFLRLTKWLDSWATKYKLKFGKEVPEWSCLETCYTFCTVWCVIVQILKYKPLTSKHGMGSIQLYREMCISCGVCVPSAFFHLAKLYFRQRGLVAEMNTLEFNCLKLWLYLLPTLCLDKVFQFLSSFSHSDNADNNGTHFTVVQGWNKYTSVRPPGL